jgi:hypothetical protein
MLAKHYLLRGLLAVICLYHIAMGVLANINKESMVALVKKVIGVTIEPDEQLLYIIKPFGVYVIVFGVLMGLAAWNPIKNRSFISVGIGLFVIRAIQRFAFAHELETVFNISHQRNIVSAALVSAFAIALLILRLRLHADIKRDGLPAAEQSVS